MTIELQNLLPYPLIEIPHDESEIWEADSVTFTSGEMVLLVAGSGKGKTSLLSSIYGIRKDFKGEIYVDHKNIQDNSEKQWSDLRKSKLSYIFQGLELFDELSAIDNILIKNRISSYKSESEIHLMAEKIGIDGFLKKKAGLLSFGQKQRVAIIRALCQELNFLLADEIFSHLDSETEKLVFELVIEELKPQNAGLILTSLEKNSTIEFNKTYQL